MCMLVLTSFYFVILLIVIFFYVWIGKKFLVDLKVFANLSSNFQFSVLILSPELYWWQAWFKVTVFDFKGKFLSGYGFKFSCNHLRILKFSLNLIIFWKEINSE